MKVDSLEDLIAYKKRLEEQKQALKQSTFFYENEKYAISRIYEILENHCERRIEDYQTKEK